MVNNKKILRGAVVVISIFIIILLPDFTNSINGGVEEIFYSIRGVDNPDTNIVLIEIDNQDIEQLGGWPLKRSYYALLINKLLTFDVAAIGLEVFLSSSSGYQNIYSNLIIEELQKTDKVLLSCLISNLKNIDGKLIADTIIYPQIKSKYADVKTGHINFLELDGIYIPQKVESRSGTKKSFSNVLASFKIENDNSPGLLKLNFHSSFNSFKKYNLLQFFELLESDIDEIQKLKNKIVIIGVSDPTIAKSIRTTFDERLPGLGLHAFAVDNLLTGRFLSNENFKLSSFLFILLISVLVFNFNDKKLIYISVFLISVFLISYILFTLLNVELNNSAYIIPGFLLLVFEMIISIAENKFQLREVESDKEILERALILKEESLFRLQKDLEKSEESSPHLLNQIDQLQSQIKDLKNSQLDEEAFEKPELTESVKNFQGIIYSSESINNIVELIKKTAPTDATVLVLGESGTGKELVANAIHNLSNRKNENFIAVNCAALPDNLLESELFGHVKGAFTDAIASKIGRFEAADKGTIFLDEIGETSGNFQAKLLRVIQSGEFQKVGSSETEQTDVRVVAATNKNLEELVKAKKFREDLYYRLNVIIINLPPLNKRKEDIELLANHFAYCENENLKISKAVMNILIENEWKGNIRELESVIKRAAIFTLTDNREIIKISDLPAELAKYDRANLETLILDSLREKDFSHSSINETANELGSLSRTIISENFRGIFFKNYVQSNFDLETACRKIAATEDENIYKRVSSKGETYVRNIEKDLRKISESNFEEVKLKFSSKYKNLPRKYHQYLDGIIKNLLEN